MAARWTDPARSWPAACFTSILDTPTTARRLAMFCSPSRWMGSRAVSKHAAIFAVRETCLLQVEIAFDAPAGLVGDLAVAQQHVNELPFRGDQFARQISA